ncbi:RNA polymerase-binding protein RbpA [Pseudonocardia sp.]|uniref:RNA polymerase-binding protein RbpA n=1 Tax=Pseudonocardia sp. TaxID=60912 RepID=UPI003D131BB7
MIGDRAIRAPSATARRREVSYWCANGHQTRRAWSAAAAVPERWECRHCGLPAGRDDAHPPGPAPTKPYKSPLDHMLERRSEAECEALLAEALQGLRARRRARSRLARPHGPLR